MTTTDPRAKVRKEPSPAADRSPVAAFAVEREALIGSFAAADELITAARAGRVQVDPGLIDLTERLAIRMLVKHHGWLMTGPGELRRHRR